MLRGPRYTAAGQASRTSREEVSDPASSHGT
jgi:hypothetical protein